MSETLRKAYEADIRNKMRRSGISGELYLKRTPEGVYRRTDIEADFQSFARSMDPPLTLNRGVV